MNNPTPGTRRRARITAGLHPLHRSVLELRQRALGFRPRPAGMSAIAITSEVREAIEQIALDIFTDMTNSGASLQETLAAIYLSGAEHAKAIMREERGDA